MPGPHRIPLTIREELQQYKAGNHPYPFGDFLTAILANDFVEAAKRADNRNQHLLFDYAMYLYNELPGRSHDPRIDYWGSYEAVANKIAEQYKAKVAAHV
jgi:hypothetical protein